MYKYTQPSAEMLANEEAYLRKREHYIETQAEMIRNSDAALARRSCASESRFIDIVFDGPPGSVSGRFVEVENEKGASINPGEWIERPDGLWALRIPRTFGARRADQLPAGENGASEWTAQCTCMPLPEPPADECPIHGLESTSLGGSEQTCTCGATGEVVTVDDRVLCWECQREDPHGDNEVYSVLQGRDGQEQ